LKSNAVKAASALLLNALIFGLSWWPFRQLQAAGLHPLWATSLTYAVALLLVSLFWSSAWLKFRHHPMLWLLLLSSGLCNLGFNWAVTTGDVVRVILLFYLMPMWSAGLAWWLLGERPGVASLVRVGLALAGVGLVLTPPDSAWPVPQGMADGLALMAGFFFALTNVLLRKLTHIPGPSRVLAMFSGGCLTALAVATVGVQGGWVAAPHLPWSDWPLALALSLGFLAANLGLQYGAARLSAHTTALIMPAEIMVATVSSVALGAAGLSVRSLLGATLITLAALAAAWTDPPHQEPLHDPGV